MPIVSGYDREYSSYISDNGNTYQVASTSANVTAGGGTPGPAGANPPFPRGWKVRGVYGRGTGGIRTFLPIFDPSSGIWLGTTLTFEKYGIPFDVQGKRGEDRFDKGG